MNTFLQTLEKNFLELQGKTALKDSSGADHFTYDRLDDYSARVYRYLKENNIKKEDVVLICLKSGSCIAAIMLGVWKAGAAFIAADPSMPRERLNIIISESGTKLVIDEKLLSEIEKLEPLEGRETVDPHDAAYIIYTSGSTGAPKGIIHEYGNLDESINGNRVDGIPSIVSDDVMAAIPPLYFTATMDCLCKTLNEGAALLLMDPSHVRDPKTLISVFEKEGVTATFMTPSLYRVCGKLNSQMRILLMGGEPVSDIYDPNIRICNGYSLTEAGRGISLFTIDKKYDLTPIGHNGAGETVVILDENGAPVKPGEMGELCFENKYFRGYVGVPEKDPSQWLNGLFRSGDLASADAKGDITIHGRIDEMVKINGQRIEPKEIEATAIKVLGLTWAAAKGFVLPERSFVSLYYTDDVTLEPAESRERLSEYLPAYMLPTYFVRISDIPVLPSGKLDRKKLPMPNTEDYRKEYSAPVTPLQKKLCALFEKVLKTDRIGIDDDYYEQGADSLKTIRLINEADIPELDFSVIHKYRTIRKIAEKLENASGREDLEALDERAKREGVPLFNSEVSVFSFQMKHPKIPVANLMHFMRVRREDIDIERLIRALQCVMEVHPFFQTILKRDVDGVVKKYFDPTMTNTITVEDVSEQDIEKITAELIYPFELQGHPLYRIRILRSEEYIYLYVDLCHVLSDGDSLRIFFEDLSKAYHNEKLEKDYHYLLSKRTIDALDKESTKAAARYNDLTYGSKEFTKNITLDHCGDENHASMKKISYGIEPALLKAFLKEKNTTINALSIAAGLLAIHKHEHASDICNLWLFNGRESALHQNVIGCLFSRIPVAVSFDEIHSADQLIRCVNEQIQKGLEMSADPFAYRSYDVTEDVFFIVRTMGSTLSSLGIKGISSEPLPVPDNYFAVSKIDIMVFEEADGEIIGLFRYNDKAIDNSTAERFAAEFVESIQEIVNGKTWE